MFRHPILTLLLLSICSITIHRAAAGAQCRPEDKSALLSFRRTVTAEPSSSDNCTPYDWKETTDCCSWDGVQCCSWEDFQCEPSNGTVLNLFVTFIEFDGTQGGTCYKTVSYSLSSTSSLFQLSSLQLLDLTGSNLRQSVIPDEISKLTQLRTLRLTETNLTGPIPDAVGSLTNLEDLQLNSNSLSGGIPPSIVNLKKLRILNLCDCGLTGSIPIGIANLPNLQSLRLCGNSLTGTIPAGVFSHPKLTELDLSSNQLRGSIPTDGSSKFTELDLSSNQLDGPIPTWLFGIPSLYLLDLGHNKLGPLIPFSKPAKTYLFNVFLGGNNITGPFPSSLFHLTQLFVLDLQDNRLTGAVEWDSFKNMHNLSIVTLSYNRGLVLKNTRGGQVKLPSFDTLSMKSCDLTEIPYFLGRLANIRELDVSENRISGAVFKQGGWKQLRFFNGSHNQITAFEYPYKGIQSFDLSHNMLRGPLPVPPASLTVLTLAHNRLSGVISTKYCDLNNLMILDLGYNELEGVLPSCLMNVSAYLTVLSLQHNRFRGAIPDTFGDASDQFYLPYNTLSVVMLGNNNFEGPLPRSLAACHRIRVVDVGNNRITDTFPSWLGQRLLRILVLSSNRFHGSIEDPATEDEFSTLQILDVSSNNFTGPLPSGLLRNLRRNMTYWPSKISSEGYFDSTALNSYDRFYQFVISIDVMVKGVRMKGYSALSNLTVLDFSNNQFWGGVPEVIGDLRALKTLSLSRNKLSGEMWPTIGKMRDLESLDLSENHLSGRIPPSLMNLKHLEFLNMSYNSLRGPIPRGKFPNISYVGNPGLCHSVFFKNVTQIIKSVFFFRVNLSRYNETDQ